MSRTSSSNDSVEGDSDAAGGADGGSGDEGEGGLASSSDSSSVESCYGLFHWLQKDAYKNTGGRNDPAWPPHTTTVLEVHCVDASGTDQIVASAFRDNHGTDPGTVDANGNPMLTEVKVSDPAPASREQLTALLASYTQCECAPATQFLSMTSAQGALESQILSTVVSYIQANLVCTGSTTTAQLAAMLQSGDYDDAIAAFGSCSWADGTTFAAGLDQATSTVLASLNSTLASYHVCNNDAMLEAQQWNTFVATGNVVACDNTQSICHGPSWFYNP